MRISKLLYIAYLITNLNCNATIDLIVFSYNRGMQLYATIESSKKYFKGLGNIHVLYRAADQEHEHVYRDIKKQFNVHLVRQSKNFKKDFKPLFSHIVKTSQASHILLAVDDIIVKDYVDLEKCAQLIERHHAYAFYLRLGKNINYNYMQSRLSPLPCMNEVEIGIFEWKFNEGDGDWGYPNSVDMTLFRKEQILNDIRNFEFYSPNTFEGAWAQIGSTKILHRTGLCFINSTIVNIPANQVQTAGLNRNMNKISPQELLKKYQTGYKIDIHKFFKLNNNSPHYEVSFDFIKR